MEEGAQHYYQKFDTKTPYVPGRVVACAADDATTARSLKTEGTGFKTAVRKGLVSLRVLYGNERYAQGMTVWVESEAVRMPWAGGDYIFQLPSGPKFVLVPEDQVRLVTPQ